MSQIILGIFIPFVGTAAGAGCVYFMKNGIRPLIQKALLGFASGVMVAASVWSLLIPAMDMSEHMGKDEPEGMCCGFKKTTMLVLAVTLHNIPEGMAVGVMYAGVLASDSGITMAGAFALSLGIAIQNFPEGAIISLPLKSEGAGKNKAFLLGALSGAVEPAGALLTVRLYRFIVPALPYLLAFAAGAMIYVVVEELIPEASEGEHSNIGTIGFAAGFTIMMILDVALG